MSRWRESLALVHALDSVPVACDGQGGYLVEALPADLDAFSDICDDVAHGQNEDLVSPEHASQFWIWGM